MDKNCDNCIYSGRPSYEWPCAVCTTAYVSAPSKWESIVAKDTNVPSWIPVSERLPNHLDSVLCYTNFEEVRIWQWHEGWKSWIGIIADYGKNVVTHWMPLPEPPKEGGYE